MSDIISLLLAKATLLSKLFFCLKRPQNQKQVCIWDSSFKQLFCLQYNLVCIHFLFCHAGNLLLDKRVQVSERTVSMYLDLLVLFSCVLVYSKLLQTKTMTNTISESDTDVFISVGLFLNDSFTLKQALAHFINKQLSTTNHLSLRNNWFPKHCNITHKQTDQLTC